MIRSVLIGVGIAISCSIPAQANWQFTTWGMSPDAVIAASNALASPLSAKDMQGKSRKEKRAVLGMPYTSGQFVFLGTFLFVGDRLSEIDLELTGGDPSTLVRAIRDKYGVPVREISRNGEGEWVSDGDHILLYNIVGHWTLSYFPSAAEDAKGL